MSDLNTSALFPALHPKNLQDLDDAVDYFPVVYIHGDGNIYPNKKESDDRLLYHNDHPANAGAGYRVEFKKGDTLPINLDELEKALVAAMNDEKKQDRTKEKIRTSSNPNAMPLKKTATASSVEDAAKPAEETKAEPAKPAGKK